MNVEELAAALTDTRLLSNATLADAAALLLEQQATITELRATRDEVVDELAEARATIDRLTAERDDVKLDHVREVIDHERTILTLEAERKLADDLAIDLQLALQYTDEVDASASLAAWRVARSSTPTPTDTAECPTCDGEGRLVNLDRFGPDYAPCPVCAPSTPEDPT